MKQIEENSHLRFLVGAIVFTLAFTFTGVSVKAASFDDLVSQLAYLEAQIKV